MELDLGQTLLFAAGALPALALGLGIVAPLLAALRSTMAGVAVLAVTEIVRRGILLRAELDEVV
jgi:hypothetical protein